MKKAQREPIINFSQAELFSSYGEIDVKILTTSVSENETLYILTELSYLYFQEQGKEKKIPFSSINFNRSR